MNRTLLMVIAATAFGLVGMWAAYLDRGYSPVICAVWGGVVGCGVVYVAELRK